MTFNNWYTLALIYYKENGNLLVPRNYITPTGQKLGYWIANQRKAYHKGYLTNEQIKKLESINMNWGKHKDNWSYMYKLAQNYYKVHGNFSLQKNSKDRTVIQLNKWLTCQYHAYLNGNLTKEKINLLEQIGIDFTTKNSKRIKPHSYNSWDKMYNLAVLYFEEHGNLLVPQKYITATGEALGAWITRNRHDYLNDKLSNEQIIALNRIGMNWDALSAKWDKMYEQAATYSKDHGNLLVPYRYMTSSGERLGIWIFLQRRYFWQNKLSSLKISALERIGMVWNIKKYKEIYAYIETLKTQEPPIIIDRELNSSILNNISLSEFQSKINFLLVNNISPIDSNGNLIDIFTMASTDVEIKYGLSLESIIPNYKNTDSKSLELKK